MTARAIRRGETMLDRTLGTDIPTMVLGPCTHRALGYYCAPCNQICASAGNLLFHLEQPGDHRVAVWCGQCRTFREADQAQLDALTQPMLEATDGAD